MYPQIGFLRDFSVKAKCPNSSMVVPDATMVDSNASLKFCAASQILFLVPAAPSFSFLECRWIASSRGMMMTTEFDTASFSVKVLLLISECILELFLRDFSFKAKCPNSSMVVPDETMVDSNASLDFPVAPQYMFLVPAAPSFSFLKCGGIASSRGMIMTTEVNEASFSVKVLFLISESILKLFSHETSVSKQNVQTHPWSFQTPPWSIQTHH